MEKKIVKCLRVKKDNAEEIRSYLIAENILNEDYKICNDGKFVFFPLKENIEIDKTLGQVVEININAKNKKFCSYKDFLRIPSDLLGFLPSSFDVIGSIILVKLASNLFDYRLEIGNALLKANKNVRTVCAVKNVVGEFRTRDLEVIAGEDNFLTVHKEYNIKFFVDVDKTYFSPRLANERKRIAGLVGNNEIICDMFAGVAPFSIMISKFANPGRIVAIDKNEYACDLANRNIRLNNVLDKIEVFNYDASDIDLVFRNKNIVFDRVIMNLPFKSIDFLNIAFSIVKKNCVIHLYVIEDKNQVSSLVKKIDKIAFDKQLKIVDIKPNLIKSYSPREFYISIDITARKK